ncbi:NACHT domain-containing protein [Reichenbachiella agariperforans]|uniref:NACHT domain-containing protein n=1 Tax=Reichenbachiella agariperforans TaxID=156994 RepID=UPI001C08C9E8|nr:hypothetical protein [Reichenbachiella agariperforans]MBU2912745.1 hypothetical protein [Reichenbachiella agariperforans]
MPEPTTSTIIKGLEIIFKLGKLINQHKESKKTKFCFKKALDSTIIQLNEIYNFNHLQYLLRNQLDELIERFEPYGHLNDLQSELSEKIEFDTLPPDFYADFQSIFLNELSQYRESNIVLQEYLRTSQIDQTYENAKNIPRVKKDTEQILKELETLNQRLDFSLEEYPTKKQTGFSNAGYHISRTLIPASNTDASIVEPRLLELIQDQKRIVILGFAGSGKSDELNHLNYALSKEDEVYFPVKINLGDCYTKELGITGLLDISCRGWQQIYPKQLVILIDGLDEVDKNEQQVVIKQINSISQDQHWRDAVIVVTCRNNFYKISSDGNGGSLIDFKSYYLEPFDSSQIYEYVNKRLDGDAASNFLEQINNAGFKDEQYTPFYLVNLINFFIGNAHRLPASKAELFNHLISDKKEREIAKAKTRGVDAELIELELDLSIEKTAFIFQCTDKNFLSNIELQSFIQDRSVREALFSAYLLDNGSEGKWKFEHNNFKEYLSAKFLLSKEPEFIHSVLLIEKLNKVKPRWLNTLGFLISLMPKETLQTNGLLDFLVEHDPESVIRIEKDKVEIKIREKLFYKLFEDYTSKGLYTRSPKFTVDDLGQFIGDSEKVCNYLISQINDQTTEVGIESSLRLISKSQHAQFYKSKIEQNLRQIIFNNESTISKKCICISRLHDFKIDSIEIIRDLLSTLDLKTKELKSVLFYYIKRSQFLEDFLSDILDWYTEINRFSSDFRYSVLLKIDRPESFDLILEKFGKKEQYSSDDSFINDTLVRLIELSLHTDSIEKKIYNCFREYGIFGFDRKDTITSFKKYITLFNLNIKYFNQLAEEFKNSESHIPLNGMAVLLNQANVELLVKKILNEEYTFEQLRLMRNFLSHSDDPEAFEMLYQEINKVTNNQLIWEPYIDTFSEIQKIELEYLFDKKIEFCDHVKRLFKSTKNGVINHQYLYSDFKDNWNNPEFSATRNLLVKMYDSSITLSEFDEYTNSPDNWEYFTVFWLRNRLNQENRAPLQDKHIQFLMKWTKSEIASNHFKNTYSRNEDDSWRYNPSGLHACCLACHFKLDLEEYQLKQLIKLDSSLIPYITSKKNDDSLLLKSGPNNSPLIQYVINNLGEEIVKTEIVNNLEKEDLFKDVIFHHLQFIRVHNLVEYKDLFLRFEFEDEYQLVQIWTWYVELNGDVSLAIDKLKQKIDKHYRWNLIEPIIEKDNNALVPYLHEELLNEQDSEQQVYLISWLLKCKHDSALETAKNWILDKHQFPNDSWPQYMQEIPASNRIDILVEIYRDSIEKNYGNHRAFHNRHSYLELLVTIGKQYANDFEEVSKRLKELNEVFPDNNRLHEAISDLEFGFYNSQSQSYDLKSAIQLL